jgi:hypothetical protein
MIPRGEKNNAGTSLIDVLISIGVIVLLFGAIYLVYFSLYSAIANIEVRDDATAVINQKIETIRNMPYASVGIVGGIPSGIIPAQQPVTYGNFNFIVATDIRNVQDPAGQSFGEPTGTVDYKTVQFTISCPSCQSFNPLSLTTTVAPPGLQAVAGQGSLFVNVFDSNGNGVPNANVTVVNPSITPAINLTDTTNNSGTLQLVGVPTSTQGYQITVSKAGYSSAQTYSTGGAGNPNPLQPNITVAQAQLSTASFAIDRTSVLSVSATNNVCAGIADIGLSITGSKLIGSSPDVLKFATTSITGSSGTIVFPNMEWDIYTLALTSSSYDLAGTTPFSPLTINPSATPTFDFVLAPKIPKSLLATIIDAATGAGVPGATVTLSGGAFSQTRVAWQSTWTDTDWSNGAFSAQSGGIDTGSIPGTMQLSINASGTYDTSATEWLISKTIDLGTSGANIVSLAFTPATEPPSTGAGSAQFQLAANNDNASWNFIGPDGTSGSYYTASSTIANLNGNRYLRYKVFLSTQDPATSPTITNVTIGFSSPCMPQAQILFSGLSSGSYTATVSAPNYNATTTSVTISANTQSTIISLVHQ